MGPPTTRREQSVCPKKSNPPHNKTFPLGKIRAECEDLATSKVEAMGSACCVFGFQRSRLFIATPAASTPPAINTVPSDNSVAV